MSEANPYAAPSANLAPPPSPVGEGTFVPGGQVVTAQMGLTWVTEGFRLFFAAPWQWLAALAAWLLVNLALMAIPIVGSLVANVCFPMFAAGFYTAGAALKKSATIDISVMFAGFRDRASQLLVVGALQLLGMMVAIATGFVVGGASIFLELAKGKTDFEGDWLLRIVLGVLVAMLLVIPVSMAGWLAPGLVILERLDGVEALKQSFDACLKNFMPYLVFGVVASVALFVGLIPLGLGLVVVGPALLASFYPQYASIFLRQSKAATA